MMPHTVPNRPTYGLTDPTVLVGRSHCPARAVHDRTDIHARLTLVLDELTKSCFKNPFHAPRRMARACSALKERVQVRSLPESILEFIALLHRPAYYE
jgi:hypothetical protein